jgi:hypothetical protein
MKILRMRFARWISKATHTQILILVAFPRQKWIRERASILRFTYIASLLIFDTKDKFFSSFWYKIMDKARNSKYSVVAIAPYHNPVLRFLQDTDKAATISEVDSLFLSVGRSQNVSCT